MKKTLLKVSRIGNSRGIRLPVSMLRKYHITDQVIAEEREDEIVLRPIRSEDDTLTWEETYKEMADSGEDWSHWDEALADGLEEIPWEEGGEPVPERKGRRSGK